MTMIGPILALDIATITGWAIGPINATAPLNGSHRIAAPGADIAYTLVKFERWLLDFLTVKTPSLVVFEAPVPRSAAHGFQTARKLLGLIAVCELVCFRSGIQCREAAIQTVRKHFCGNGRADKEAVQAMCAARGWAFADDNAADALALWSYSAETLKRRNIA